MGISGLQSVLSWHFYTVPVLTALELVIAYLFFSRVAQQRLPHWGVLLLALAAFLGQDWLMVLLEPLGEPWVVSYALILLVLGLAGFHIKVWTAAISAVLLTAFRAATSIAAYEAYVWLYQRNYYYTYTLESCSEEMKAAVAFAGYLFCALVAANLIALAKKRRLLPLPLCVLPGVVMVGIAWTAVWMGREMPERWEKAAMALGSVAVAAGTVLVVLAYQVLLERWQDTRLERRQAEQLQLEKSYYEILEHQNQQLRSYAHDAKNHLAAIKNLNTDPKVDEYIRQMEAQLQAYTSCCHSGNRALDVMVDKYVTACQIKEVHFSYDVRLCNLGGVDDFDLVAILGNLLDNALTAAQDSRERWMELATAVRNGYQVVVVENSCDRPPVEGEDGLRTTKKERELHGFGLKSVAQALKKYQGDFQWEYDGEKKHFLMTVMIGQRVSVRESRRMAQDAKC